MRMELKQTSFSDIYNIKICTFVKQWLIQSNSWLLKIQSIYIQFIFYWPIITNYIYLKNKETQEALSAKMQVRDNGKSYIKILE